MRRLHGFVDGTVETPQSPEVGWKFRKPSFSPEGRISEAGEDPMRCGFQCLTGSGGWWRLVGSLVRSVAESAVGDVAAVGSKGVPFQSIGR